MSHSVSLTKPLLALPNGFVDETCILEYFMLNVSRETIFMCFVDETEGVIFMAWSDKKLVNEARKRFDRLNKSELNTDTLEILKNNLTVFYSKNKGVRKTSLSGISIKKSMNVGQRKEMRQILRSFIKGEESKPQQIKREYDKMFGQYEKGMQRWKRVKAKSYKEMLGELNNLKRILEDRKALTYLGSQVIKETWERQQEEGLDKEIVREVLNKYASRIEEEEENGVRNTRTTSEIVADVFADIESMVNAYDGII